MPVSGRGRRPRWGHIDKRGVAALGDIKIADGVEGNASRLFKGQIEGGKDSVGGKLADGLVLGVGDVGINRPDQSRWRRGAEHALR